MKMPVLIFWFFVLMAAVSSCRQDFMYEKSDARLTFSTDTVQFDTIFSGVGSTTRTFTVKNKNPGTINISSVFLENGNSSKFRLNVNGSPGKKFSDIQLRQDDSIYIFVEVTIDPNQDKLLEEDRLKFSLNGNEQEVVLEAFGQDVHLIDGEYISNETWGQDKPYLIYNSFAVDSGAYLKLEAGARLHFHRGSELIVLGTLISEGTADEPVILQGDRLEDMYFDVPGQWEGVWLTKFSHDNYLKHTHILNANYGIWTDSVQNQNAKLMLENCLISHHTLFGLWGNMSSVFAFNTEISDCGFNCINLTRGGYYEFYHCTVGNYYSHAVRRDAAVRLNNYLEHEQTLYLSQLNQAYFGNCIIWGDKETEINIDLYNEGVENNWKFENSIIKIGEESNIDTSQSEHFSRNLTNIPPKFKDYAEYDFSLDTLSDAKDAADPNIIQIYPAFLEYDFYQNSRLSDNAPDLGAYERIETEDTK